MMNLRQVSRLVLVLVLGAGIIFIALWRMGTFKPVFLQPSADFRMTESLPKNYFVDQVEPILTARCVVCHACYDAPCQFKMSAAEGLARGANKEKVYNGTRLIAATPSRLFIDAHSVEDWRERDFFNVISDPNKNNSAELSSVMSQMLLLKRQNPLPADKLLGDGFDIRLNRDQVCPTNDEMGDYLVEQPLGGMPYALPGLNPNEHQILLQWLAHGAPLPEPQALSQQDIDNASEFEQWLNQNNNKMRLSARYIYEHLFTSHLYFEDQADANKRPTFFNLVRSTTPPGETIDVIATRRPFSDPGVERVYYRLQPVISTIVKKAHQPYAINSELRSKWQSWFVDKAFEVDILPSYDPNIAANPLTAFAQLPVESRYRFMLERAQHTIMGYIKGQVCRGQVALNVINDRFWVLFMAPEVAVSPSVNAFYATQQQNLHLPAEKDSTALAVSWLEFAERQGDYLRARNQFLAEQFKQREHLNINSIWAGDGVNTNASLTVFRHFDNATVVKGLVGTPPKTTWVIDYALLERIHYLLVAGFDVYGNYGHQLLTRLYMDFLRMEGESNFLNLLPPATRRTELANWYRKAGPELTDFLEGDINSFEQQSHIQYATDDPKQELYDLLLQHVAAVQPPDQSFSSDFLSDSQIKQLAALDYLPAQQATLLPETTMIVIRNDSNPEEITVFTLLRNSAHFNVNSLFQENQNREYSKDSVTLVKGILGSYPDAIWQLNAADLETTLTLLSSIDSENAYQRLLDKVGVRRTNPNFWAVSDELLQWSHTHYPIDGGLLDYNRLENR